MRSINEKCAVIAVSNSKDFDVARLAYLGLWSLQHRGQDSSGIASFDGIKLHVHKKSGLVSNVYDEDSLAQLRGKNAIGHNRYSTSGGNDDNLNQPYTDESIKFAFAHNGNLPYTDKLMEYISAESITYTGQNDSGLMALALANELKKGLSLEDALTECWPLFTGAFSCVGLHGDSVFAFRDQHGIRPLALGRTDHGFVAASETVALDIIGADYIRDIQPGELVVFHQDEMESYQIQKGREQVDVFEFVYLARPDSRVAGQSIYSARARAGKALSEVAPVDVDIILGIPDSGLPAATGYAHGTGIPLELGLTKNRYIGRTFIEPEKIRKSKVQLKFNTIVEIVAGKNIVLIDDSLVRGNTLKYVVKLLREYGAKEIHVRIASPPVKFPDFYGIDTPRGNDLIANSYSVDEICTLIHADSLKFLPLEEFIKSTGLPASRLCLSCFNGEYPIPVPTQVTRTT